MPNNRAHMGGLLEDVIEGSERTEKRAETGSETGPWNKNDGKREEERRRGGGKDRDKDNKDGTRQICTGGALGSCS